ncbi:hypothetical protein PCE1_002861 [Barthelona sp. PCE]
MLFDCKFILILFFVMFSRFFSIFLLTVACIFAVTSGNVIQRAQLNIVDKLINGSHVNYYPHLGKQYIGMYFIQLTGLGLLDKSEFSVERMKRELMHSQREDGGWTFVVDQNRQDSELDASIYSYWALKAMGMNPNTHPMLRARAYILSRGGIEAAPAMLRMWLCLFGNYDWDEFPNIPVFPFIQKHVFKLYQLKSKVAQWVYPHVLPIAYLKRVRAVIDLGPRFVIDELYLNGAIRRTEMPHNVAEVSGDVLHELKAEILNQLQPCGTFGTYTVSTLYSLFALQHYSTYVNGTFFPEFKRIVAKSQRYIEHTCYFSRTPGAYQGILDDGHFWDTILAGQALAESGYGDGEVLRKICDYLIDHALLKTHSLHGVWGVAYGKDFWRYPDIDDTAELILLLEMVDRVKYRTYIDRMVEWVFTMQNWSGGWGAFNKDRVPSAVIKYFARSFLDSAELFDDATVDVTGHVLEALAAVGYTQKDKRVALAVRFVSSWQDGDGAYWGRWGVNYIYGTWSAVVGLHRIGVPVDSKAITKALDWIILMQNDDGGWGESTMSYNDPKWKGKGLSTDTQTAWACLALIEAYHAMKCTPDQKMALERGIAYLETRIGHSRRWSDHSAVGTGHPGIVFMQYPAYSQTFPLITLGRYYSLLRVQNSVALAQEVE